MNALRRLLPFETLSDAAEVLNQICREENIENHYSIRDFLAWAISGEVFLSVELPEDFHVAQKNLKKYSDTPLRPRFPAGTMHCFIPKSAAFKLSRNKPLGLDTVFTISNDGAEDIYYSAKPFMAITIADLGIRDDQLIRCINAIYALRTSAPSSEKASPELPPVPGKVPKNSNGRLAIRAGWELENKLKRKPLAKEVMDLLIKWARNGEHSDVLMGPGDDGRSVHWLTSKSEKRIYKLKALERTLETWCRSRG